uniref:Potassium channel domain-containing protein n=1 Tax=Parascaris univalens TaxID=6257 RepID=A0A915AQ93_PARUN
MQIKLWKNIFNPQTNEIIRVVVPQLMVIILLFSYVLFGSGMFVILDENLAKENFTDIILFSFTTIATIGYGNISPSTPLAQLFCIVFSIFGIPMTLLTLANLGKYLTKSYWMALVCLGREIRWRACENSKLPLSTILTLFIITFAFGSLLFYHKGKGFSIDDIYFSIISFATVGFGDKFPTADDPIRLIGMMCYLVWGMILMTTMFSVVSAYLRMIHYLGRQLRGARDVHVWFGGKSMKVSKLLEIVAAEFNATPRQLKGVLRDLDGLITAAVGENQLLSRRPSSLFKSRRSSRKRIGYSLQEGLPAEGRKQRYNFLKTMDHRQNEQPIKEETIMINKSFFKERQSIDRRQSVDLGELNRRTIARYEI